MECSESPKRIEKTIEAFVCHKGKGLYEIWKRMFVPQLPLKTCTNQLNRTGAVDVVRRVEQVEHFVRPSEIGLDKRSNEIDSIV